jgi:hypothetical protein
VIDLHATLCGFFSVKISPALSSHEVIQLCTKEGTYSRRSRRHFCFCPDRNLLLSEPFDCLILGIYVSYRIQRRFGLTQHPTHPDVQQFDWLNNIEWITHMSDGCRITYFLSLTCENCDWLVNWNFRIFTWIHF